MIYESSGILHYEYETAKVVLNVDQDIVNYYRSLIPKYIQTNTQYHPAHISVVRKELHPPLLRYWGAYEGEEIPFAYSPIIKEDRMYYWLNVLPNKRLSEIRLEMGLPYCRGFGGLYHSLSGLFHITIANKKKLLEV